MYVFVIYIKYSRHRVILNTTLSDIQDREIKARVIDKMDDTMNT